MNRKLMATLVPPLAVCRYGCASCCAAPIAVFWITGIVGIAYGVLGGPAELDHISWPTLLLGITLWLIAAVWADNTIRGVDADQTDPACSERTSSFCRVVRPKLDESNPLDETKKFRHE